MSNSLTVRHTEDPAASTAWPDPHQDRFAKRYLGFWLYLMTDCLLFAALFVTYAVLHGNTNGGPIGKELFDLKLVLGETLILLASSATCGHSVLAAARKDLKGALSWLVATTLLGTLFLYLEKSEFAHLINEGATWRESAFLSIFFTLVGTHGAHIFAGLLWGSLLIAQLFFNGLNIDTFRRLQLFSLFWHFLDLIWIFIFTFVYLMGVL